MTIKKHVVVNGPDQSKILVREFRNEAELNTYLRGLNDAFYCCDYEFFDDAESAYNFALAHQGGYKKAVLYRK